MNLFDLWEVVTSESFLKAASYAGTLLGGGMGLRVWDWVSAGFRDGEVGKIVKALKGGKEVTNDVVTVPASRPAGCQSDPRTVVPCLKIVGTNICVNDQASVPRRWFTRGESPTGVIFHDGEDKSGLYSRAELRRIASAAKARRRHMQQQDIDAGRKLLADHIPDDKPKKVVSG